MGEKHCNDLLDFKAKETLMCESQCAEVPQTQMNKTSALKKKDSSVLILLEEAHGRCWIPLSNGHFSRRLFLTESVDKLIKRLSHFKIIPKSSSN